MRKALSLALVLLMAIALLAGCGGSGSSAPAPAESQPASTAAPESGTGPESEPAELTGKIVMWGWQEELPILNGYRETHPGVELEFVMVDSGDYLTKIQSTLASGGQLPDIIWGEILTRGKLFEMDILEDLSQAPYNIDLSLFEEYVVPTMTNEAGEVLGVEWGQNPAGLAYRRNLATEYLGTDDRTEIEAMFPDWDAFIEKGKEVVAQSGGSVYMLPSLGDVYYILNGQSTTPRVADGKINEAAALELFTGIAKFRDAGIVSKVEQWTPAWFASFGTDEAVFHPMASWGIGNHVKPNDPNGEGNWGIIVPPGGGFSWGGLSYSVSKTSENKELAWDFIQWAAMTDEGNAIQMSMDVIPSMATARANPYFSEYEDPYFGDTKPLEVLVQEVVPTIHVNQITPYDMTDIIAMELVLSSMNADYSITPEQATELYLEEMLNGAPELVVE